MNGYMRFLVGGVTAAAVLGCSLLSWRTDDFLVPEHSIEMSYSPTAPSTGTVSNASVTYASQSFLQIR